MAGEHTERLLRMWLDTLIEGFATGVDTATRDRLLAQCGQACARYHRSIETVQALQQEAHDLDDLLGQLNRQEGFWCGEWVQEGDTLHSVCTACGCPLVRAGFVEPSPAFCECSRGWVEAVFGAVLGGPPVVELKRAIGRGDAVCEFIVRLERSSPHACC